MKKKFYLLSVLVFSSLSHASAQKTTIGFSTGVNRFATQDGFSKPSNRSRYKTGFSAGLHTEIGIGKQFSLQPGLLFVTKGSIDYEKTTIITVSHIEMPVNIIYKIRLGAGRLIVGAGPYAAVAVGGSGRDKESNTDIDVRFDNDIMFSQIGQGVAYVRRFDAGINGLAGYEFTSAIFFRVNSQLGLVDTSPLLEGEPYFYKSKNFGFALSMGYKF